MNLKLLELFGGIGAVRKAFEYYFNHIEIESVDYVDNDAIAVKAYNALFNENYEPQDISKYYKKLPKVDLLFHGSPCQDFSVAGLGDVEGGGEAFCIEKL